MQSAFSPAPLTPLRRYSYRRFVVVHNITSRNGLELYKQRKRREDLRQFLLSRRRRLSPADVGLTDVGRRNTPGLRREEVAVLAGVSASWYTWLEQGRDIKVSSDVLDAISRALGLNEVEHAHLYLLAGVNPPLVEPETTSAEISRLQALVEGWLKAPAFIVDRYWDTLAANKLAHSVLGVPSGCHNYLRAFFTDPAIRNRYPNWDETATCLVGQLRVQSAQFPSDPSFGEMARELSSRNPRFAELWARHETRDSTMRRVLVRPPQGKSLRFDHMVLGLLHRSELRLMLYIPINDQMRN